MSTRHKHGGRRRRARPAWIFGLIAAAAAASVAALSSGSGHTRRPSASRPARTPAALAAGSRAPATSASAGDKKHLPSARERTAAPSPGSLPQTHADPSASSALFKSLMASLWAGIVQGSLAPALPAFFPRAAYVQLKAIASASSDWRDRLVRDYGLDIAAAHALLGSTRSGLPR